MKKIYDIFTQDGKLYETVRINGKDEDECKEQIDQYVELKQDCYSQEVEQQSRKGKQARSSKS
jgi:hypothetical protein